MHVDLKKLIRTLIIITILISLTYRYLDIETYVLIIVTTIAYLCNSKPTMPIRSKEKTKSSVGRFPKKDSQEELSEEKIKKIDKDFQLETFYTWFKNSFLKYKIAYEKNDWESINAFSTDEFVQKEKQLKEKTSKMESSKYKTREFGGINAVELCSFEQKDGKDYLRVKVDFYEIKVEYNVATGKKIKGLSGNKIPKVATVVLERKTGVQTLGRENVMTHCSKCGAPTHILTTGKCEFCNSVIKIEENWKWSNFF